MPRSFVIPSINDISSSFGSNSEIPIIFGTPGVLSIKKETPYKILVDKNE